MAVIAVLVAVAIPTFGSQLEKSRQAVDKSNLRDAYASAKLAVLNQDDSGTPLYQLKNGFTDTTRPTTKTVYNFWYNESAEDIKVVTPADSKDYQNASKGGAVMGKATTGTVLNNDGLPNSITYGNSTLKKSSVAKAAADATDDDVAGTTKKGVLVQVSYDPVNNMCELVNVTFAYAAKASEASVVTPVTLTSTGATGSANVSLTTAASVDILLDDYFQFDIDATAGLEISGDVKYSYTTTGSTALNVAQKDAIGQGVSTATGEATLVVDDGKVTLKPTTASGLTTLAAGEYTITGITVKDPSETYSATLTLVVTIS